MTVTCHLRRFVAERLEGHEHHADDGEVDAGVERRARAELTAPMSGRSSVARPTSSTALPVRSGMTAVTAATGGRHRARSTVGSATAANLVDAAGDVAERDG